MLQLDFFHDDVNIQINPEESGKEDIIRLRDSLNQFNIRNPLVTFANRYASDFYIDRSEEYVQTDAEMSDLLSEFWKDSPGGDDRMEQNVMIILSRLLHAYVIEHRELEDLRDKLAEMTEELD